MAGDEIKSSWVADFSDINAALAETAAAGDEAFKAMMDAALQAGDAITASQEHVAEKIKETGEHVHEEGVNIGESLESISHSFEQLKEVTGFAVVSEAIHKVGEEIEQATERAVKFQNMADILQITTEQYQGMAAAAEEAGVSEQVLDRAGTRMVLMLQQARDGSAEAQDKLHLLGITNQEITDGSFGLTEALRLIKERLEDSGTAAAEHNAVLAAFGIRGALAASAIRELATSHEALAEKSRELNFLQQEDIDELRKLHVEYESLKTVTENYWEKTLVYIATGVKGLKHFIEDVHNFDWGNIGAAPAGPTAASESPGVTSAHEEAAAAEETAETKRVLTREQLAAEQAEIAATRATSEERLAALQKYAADVRATYTGNVAAVAQANAQVLAEERALSDARKKFLEDAADFEYSEELKLHDDRVKMRIDATQRINADLAEAAADLGDVARDELQGQLNALALEEQATKNSYAARTISATQAYSQERQIIQQRLAAEQSTYAQLRQIYQDDAKALAQIQREEVRAQQQANQQMLQAQRQLSAHIKQEWSGVTSAMTSSLTGAITGMLHGTESFADGMRNVVSSMVDAVIGMFVQMAVQAAASWLITKAVSSETSNDELQNSAAVAAAAAMASVAAIPFYGWALAPEVGAAIYAEALAFGGGMPSAAGGMEVPEDMLAMVHKDEKVLPARYSKGLDAMVAAFADGDPHRTSGGKGSAVHLHGAPNDVVTVESVAKVLKEIDARFMLRPGR